jgi:DNA polymerase-3 subunit epsilon
LRALLDRLLGRGGVPLAAVRWVVVDCETSGLDMKRDRLLAVGGVAVRDTRVDYGDAFSATVKQATPSAPGNILVHGIGGDAQRGGRPLDEVMAAFDAWVSEGVLAAFHAPFDAAFLKRPIDFDLAQLLPALFPGLGHKALDDWLQAFGIEAPARHDALGDAAATAELLLVALAEAGRQRIATLPALAKAQNGARWLNPQ